jgi:hypothetical protein
VHHSGVTRAAGPSEFELLPVIESDDQGRAATILAFDSDDLDAAYAELDARGAAGEPAPELRRT